MDGPEVAPDGNLWPLVAMAAEASTPAPVGLLQSPLPDLSIIVVTCNSAAALDDFVVSLTQHPPRSRWELVVFDNASHDDSVALLKGRFPDARIVQSGDNHGFAYGVNAAVAASRGRFLLLANPDVRWNDDALDRLMAFLQEHPQVAAVSPRLVFPDGRPQPSARRFPDHRNIWFSRGAPWGRWLEQAGFGGRYTVIDPSAPQRADALCAACLILRRDVFITVGGMDAGYFLYVEDTDLCRRIADMGGEVWIDPTVAVIHRWGGATKRDPHLAAIHRSSIRRYFTVHHSHKRIRNVLLFSALGIADTSSWVVALLRSGRRLRSE